MMGGVHTDLDGATPIEGLYAAGETACVSINGANRLGSNSLPECLVFGARAGESAARHAAAVGDDAVSSAVLAQAADETRRLEQLLGTEGSEQVPQIREELQSTMEAAAGIYRTRSELEQGIEKVADLQARMAKTGVADASGPFNTELTAALELANLLDIGQAMLDAAIAREESRGAHQRTDFPDRDDDKFLVHQLVHREPDGGSRLEPLPVTITRWQPGERVYGR